MASRYELTSVSDDMCFPLWWIGQAQTSFFLTLGGRSFPPVASVVSDKAAGYPVSPNPNSEIDVKLRTREDSGFL